MEKMKINYFFISLNKTTTLPFNIISNRHGMITFKHLSDRNKFRLKRNILVYLIFKFHLKKESN